MTPRKAAVLLLVLLLGTCNQAIMTAPPGSKFAPAGSLIANPGFIAAHGDVSVISGLILKATGIPVADGTVVQFFTNLGKIDEQGKTNDGVVRVNLVSDSRSGTATVTAFTGSDVGASFLDGPVVGFSSGSITSILRPLSTKVEENGHCEGDEVLTCAQVVIASEPATSGPPLSLTVARGLD